MQALRRKQPLITTALVIACCVPALSLGQAGYRDKALLPPYRAAQEGVNPEVATLTDRLKSSDEEERRDALLKLVALDTPAAMPALTAALNDPSEKVRAVAATGLAAIGDPSSIQALVDRLVKEKKSPFLRKTIAYALGGFRNHQATPALVALLKDKEVEVRGAAAVAMGEFADAATVEPLTRALKDKSDFVRARAAAAIGVNRSAAAAAVPELVRLLNSDKDQEVRRQSATALGLIASPSALPALERASLDEDPYLAQSARDAIKLIEGAKR
jgi:HEAT repeat protein